MWRAFVYSNDVPDRSHQAGVRRVQAARRHVPRERARAGEERRARLPAARAVPSAVRRDAEDAADDGVPDHQGVPGPGHAPRVSRRRTSRRCCAPTRTRRGRARRSRRSIDGSLHGYARTGIAGVANIGSDRNWTGSQFNQANWYAFGRLAWDHELSSARRSPTSGSGMTFTNDAAAVAAIRSMMMHVARGGGELHDAARTRAHHGDGPPLRARPRGCGSRRADWTPTYYHRADYARRRLRPHGDGQQRRGAVRPAGARPVRATARPCPDSRAALVPPRAVDDRTAHRDARCGTSSSSATTRASIPCARCRRAWASVRGQRSTPTRFAEVSAFLAIQEREARWWRDAALHVLPDVLAACRSRRATSSRRIRSSIISRSAVPPNRDKPRCDAIPDRPAECDGDVVRTHHLYNACASHSRSPRTHATMPRRLHAPPRAPLHLRPLDRRQPRARSVRRCRAAADRRAVRHRAQARASSARTA